MEYDFNFLLHMALVITTIFKTYESYVAGPGALYTTTTTNTTLHQFFVHNFSEELSRLLSCQMNFQQHPTSLRDNFVGSLIKYNEVGVV
jgi:hypothetical protein